MSGVRSQGDSEPPEPSSRSAPAYPLALLRTCVPRRALVTPEPWASLSPAAVRPSLRLCRLSSRQDSPGSLSPAGSITAAHPLVGQTSWLLVLADSKLSFAIASFLIRNPSIHTMTTVTAYFLAAAALAAQEAAAYSYGYCYDRYGRECFRLLLADKKQVSTAAAAASRTAHASVSESASVSASSSSSCSLADAASAGEYTQLKHKQRVRVSHQPDVQTEACPRL